MQIDDGSGNGRWREMPNCKFQEYHTCSDDRRRFSRLPLPPIYRVPTVREKSVKNEKNSRSGKSQGILS